MPGSFSHRRRLVRRLRNGLRQFAGSDWGLIPVLFLFLFVMPALAGGL